MDLCSVLRSSVLTSVSKILDYKFLIICVYTYTPIPEIASWPPRRPNRIRVSFPTKDSGRDPCTTPTNRYVSWGPILYVFYFKNLPSTTCKWEDVWNHQIFVWVGLWVWSRPPCSARCCRRGPIRFDPQTGTWDRTVVGRIWHPWTKYRLCWCTGYALGLWTLPVPWCTGYQHVWPPTHRPCWARNQLSEASRYAPRCFLV